MIKKPGFYLFPMVFWACSAAADYKSDIGYQALLAQLGASVPTGDGVNVVHAEASAVESKDDPAYPIYAPDILNAQFAGKTFSFPGKKASTSPSGHATSVGARFYGKDSIAHGINTIASYDGNAWLDNLITPTALAPVNASRIANHSWIGKGDSVAETAMILRLVDRQVQRNQFIQVVGMNNGLSDAPLLGSAYNAIAVGRTDGKQDRGADAVDSVYVAGRTRPDIVAPQTTTSAATPIVAAAAALLVETGHKGGSSLSHGSIDIDSVGTVYNAERAETVKAALLAGADRATQNTSTTDNILDYRGSGHQTVNGLDDRFGAGQLNILHSYEIIAGGEQDSLEDGGHLGGIGLAGFDVDTAFGGLGSNSLGTYKFAAATDLNLQASLVWNLGVSNDLNLTTTLYDLNLELFDITAQNIAAFSASSVDNSENLWLDLLTGHHYELRVKSGEAIPFSWDYALAWHMSPLQSAPVPLPGAFSLFLSALGGFGWVVRRKR
ncbi:MULTISPECIES: PEP-CTERM domain protein [Methylomonas]|uniref:Peptidase S8/S53 domain-containing protein n=2 Tax=Methylomonas TaxID=416 RepID=A0A126T7P7_9GAMM|nr:MULTISPECIES: PEP-CTERM domain protein [Methylomonas]AMK78096.1 hypothetical protein JT25_016680 [Methylomonas denitrificans]OAI07609.1 hypothetical protein A1342_09960 [Methylomonas methanica]TCV85632.1 hypothetical protein EDE11_105194 [Methylomonas methanica]